MNHLIPSPTMTVAQFHEYIGMVRVYLPNLKLGHPTPVRPGDSIIIEFDLMGGGRRSHRIDIIEDNDFDWGNFDALRESWETEIIEPVHG